MVVRKEARVRVPIVTIETERDEAVQAVVVEERTADNRTRRKEAQRVAERKSPETIPTTTATTPTSGTTVTITIQRP
jgi:hypothetical protein